jgi:hypothetical protein
VSWERSWRGPGREVLGWLKAGGIAAGENSGSLPDQFPRGFRPDFFLTIFWKGENLFRTERLDKVFHFIPEGFDAFLDALKKLVVFLMQTSAIPSVPTDPIKPSRLRYLS